MSSTGGADDDTLSGTDQNDTLEGFAGDDRLIASAGDDSLSGGPGAFDVVSYDDPLFERGVVVENFDGWLNDVPIANVLKSGVGVDRLEGVESVIGSPGPDLIQGESIEVSDGAGDDTVHGGSGGTIFRVGPGADSFVGQASEWSRNGDWRLYFADDAGGWGAPLTGARVTYTSAFGGHAVDGWGFVDTFSGVDRVIGGRFADVMRGAAGRQRLEGGGGRDSLHGDAGDDALVGGAGDDMLDGGAGADSVNYFRDRGVQGVVVNLATGAAIDGYGDRDRLVSIENLRDTAFADSLTGSDDRNRFLMGAGADRIEGGDGVDAVNYEDPDAPRRGILARLDRGTIVDPWGATDRVSGVEEIEGTAYADVFVGDAEDNAFRGRLGVDRFIGGAGFDRVDFEGSVDFGVGVDIALIVDLETGTAIDNAGRIERLSGIEALGGTESDDIFTGDAADNYFEGRGGDDTIDGGEGRDEASYQFEGGDRRVVVDLAAGYALDTFGDRDTLRAIEIVRGGPRGDLLTGDAGENRFHGLAGADTITGGAGFDMVVYDREFRSGGVRGVVVNLATGVAVDAFGDRDRLRQIEGVAGTDQADRLTGSGAHDKFAGLGGADTIVGGAGSDWLDLGRGSPGRGVVLDLARGFCDDGFDFRDAVSGVESASGSRHDDRLTGGATANELLGEDGRDTLSGGGGADTLSGGAGNDLLSGGLGADRFVFGAGFGADRIADFGAADRLDFRGHDGVTRPADLSLRRVGADALLQVVGTEDSVRLAGAGARLAEIEDALLI